MSNAKIEELYRAIVGYEYVGGLDVAVDDQMTASVSHRGQHVQKESHACFDIQIAASAIRVYRLALDVLEHQIRLRSVHDAGVEKARDIWIMAKAMTN